MIQRRLVIAGEQYDSQDGEYLYERIFGNAFSDDPKLITKTLSRYLSRGEFQFRDMTSFLWEFNIRLLKAEKPGTFSTQRVEKKIFQYWAGGPMSPAAFQNVVGWIAKAKKSGWKHFFVTDSTLNERFHKRVLVEEGWLVNTNIHLADQLGRLEKLGSKILEARNLPSGQYQKLQKQTVTEGGFGQVPFMSDIARFFVLHQHGGLYMDVDVAPGSVELGEYSTTSHMPYLGPMLRTTDDAQRAGVLNTQGSALERKLLNLFQKNEVGRGMHYMMSAKGSPAMKRILDVAEKGNILGNGAVLKGIFSHFRENVGLSKPENIMTLTMPIDLPKIGWITSESDNIVN